MHLVINAYFWNQPYVGSGQYTRQLVYYLNRLASDLDITLIFPQRKGESKPGAVPPSVHVKLVPARIGQVGKVIFEQFQFPRACKEVGATAAHVPYWGAPLRSPVPLAVTVHDLTTLVVPEYRRGLKARLYNALVSAGARGANHIITDSYSSKLDIMEHLGTPEDDVTAVYLATTPEYTPQENSLADTAVLRKYDLPDFYVLYLGGYELHKNVTTLLLAYTYVAQALGEDYPLVLAGRKPKTTSAIYPDYDSYIEHLGLGDYVRWIGFVDEEDKPVLYRNAEVFVFPSRHEGFGLPVLEALSCGTAVVTTTGDSLPEVIGDAGFAVDPDDAREMAGAIIAAVTEDNLRAELKQKAQKQATRFSWEKTAAETLLIYDHISI
ncbi:MAG: glycosyltransferase family 4 protein [Chloroflexi bacterium]|nr:glycosyltransferase family 4 protein [Chloroflexota bacterium]